MDTWQGAWTAANNLGGGQFSGQTAALPRGLHILYAYSTDGQEATSTNTDLQSSPLISNIAAYPFTVAPPSLSPGSLNFPSQTVGTAGAPQTVKLTNHLDAALAISGITFTGADPVDFGSPGNICGASLAPYAHCTIQVTFKPTATGTRTATLNVLDGAGTTAQTVSLMGTGQ